MNINRENYELFIVDLLDETISEDVKKELQLFLMENPDIWKEVQGLDATFLKPETISYPNKAALKQSVFEDEAYFNEMAVGYLENDLTEEEKTDFEAFIQKDKLAKKAFRLFVLTKLKPDLSILFSDKDLLYHKTKVIPLIMRFGRIASVAAIFLIALFYFKPWHSRTIQPIEIQQQEKIANITDFSPVSSSNNSGSTVVEQNLNPEKSNTDQNSNSKNSYKKPVQKITNSAFIQTAYYSEPVTRGIEDRVEYQELKPKKAKPTKYILIVRPTIAANNNYTAHNNEKAIQRFAKTGEKLLNQGTTLDREQVEKGVLNVLKLASNDKINYETNNKGRISKINVNSEMLAFTLPIRKNKQ